MCVCVCFNGHVYLFICGCRCFVWLISCGSDTISSVKKAIHHFGGDCGETPLPLGAQLPVAGCCMVSGITLPADLIFVIYVCMCVCMQLFISSFYLCICCCFRFLVGWQHWILAQSADWRYGDLFVCDLKVHPH